MQDEKRREERERWGQGVKRGRRLLRHSRRDKRKLLNQEKQERNRSTALGARGLRGGEKKRKKRNAKQPSLFSPWDETVDKRSGREGSLRRVEEE